MVNILQSCKPYDKTVHEWPQIFAIVAACLSAFSCGTLFTWTSPAIPVLISNASHLEPISLEEASYFTVIPSLAAIISGPLLGVLVDVVGRKKTVAFIAVPYILAWLLIALAEGTTAFYVSRFLTGIGDATLFNSLPMYVGEIGIPKVRGLWGNLVAISIYFGQFVVNVIGGYCGIRTTAYICISFPIAHLVISIFLPEYFLLMKGNVKEARSSLQILRWKEDVDDELASLTNDVNRQTSESGTFKDLFTIATNRKALLIAIGIRGAQQLSGLPAFSFYTQYMFNQAGGNLPAITSAIIFTGVLLATNSVFAFVVDKFGRRPMMMISCFGCGVVVATEAIYFYLYQKTDLDTSFLNWIPLTGMLVYILVCSSGLGILPTLMLGELFSASVKGKALCVTNISFSIYVLSCTKMFQTLSFNFGMFVPFTLFSICCFLSVIFSYYCVPETKGKTLEEIQQSLRGRSEDKDQIRRRSIIKV